MKVGDKVTVTSCGEVRFLGVIERETKLYWIVGNYKFRKSDNTQPGEFSSAVYPYRIVPTTQEHINSLRKSKLVARLRHLSWSNLDLETLENVCAMID